MLVLSRQRDETIMIGDDIEITVVDIRGDKVRLGITAPTSIAVHRKEVYDAIKAENHQAARLADHDVEEFGSAPGAKAGGGRINGVVQRRPSSPDPGASRQTAVRNDQNRKRPA